MRNRSASLSRGSAGVEAYLLMITEVYLIHVTLSTRKLQTGIVSTDIVPRDGRPVARWDACRTGLTGQL